MADTIYAYKGKYWKPIYNFQYTGQTEEFTLEPGKYLLMCHGAQGGQTGIQAINYGGVAYGVLNLQHETKLYANVGGNGGSVIDNATPGVGGFNGGGNGGRSYNNNYATGAGGGGATDIRLLNDDGTMYPPNVTSRLPVDYVELTYIQSYGNQCINTGYIHNENTKIECDCEIISNTSRNYEALFGSRNGTFQNNAYVVFSRFNGSDIPVYNRSGVENTGSGLLYDQRIKIVTENDMMRWYQDDVEIGSVATTGVVDGGVNMMFIFDINTSSTSDGSVMDTSRSEMKLYSFKIYENDELKCDFVPCYNKTLNISGLYDIVNNTFHQSITNCDFKMGDPLFLNKSLLSRIIVAGGGGGAINMSTHLDYAGNGGGVVGGIVASHTDSVNFNAYVSQNEGYRFGRGMNAVDKTSNASYGGEGASGGGGGWYGGYANGSPDKQYSSSNGGGGSGYVFTSDSYKLEEGYVDGEYLIGEEYYLTDTFLEGGMAIQPQALVCVPVKMFNAGDTIIFPCIGETEHAMLPKGKYLLKCYGGDGGCRLNINSSPRGGYAEGILNIPHNMDIYVTVGGSGIGTGIRSSEYSQMNHQTAMFNGGGAPGKMGDILSCAGGGATDIRIGSDSLYARVIVAGGAGGYGQYAGGTGGGETGGSCQNSGYGTSPGPGTQSSSPQNASYPTINGGFGYGGNGVYVNSGYGGAGGGGWFGGSGTYPNGSNDNDKGGNGGSGYVLTEDSYKPEGYLLGEEYYLTDSILTTGGNTLPIGHTEAVIEVLDCVFVSILCQDAEGYKRYDPDTNKWVYFSSTLSPEMFEEYGYHSIPTDDGLLNEYDILIHDIDDKISSVSFDIVPPEQKISTTVKHRMNVSTVIPDIEFEEDVFDIRTEVTRNGAGSNATITLDTYVHKKEISDEKIKIYCVQVYDK